jgi:hypothetical protein
MDELRIESAEGVAALELYCPQPADATKPLGYFSVRIVDHNLSACARVYAGECAGLADLFGDMANEWKGWQRAKEWTSLEGEFQLACTADRLGHIEVWVTLASGPHPYGWRVQTVLHLQPAQLDRIARQVHSFTRTS